MQQLIHVVRVMVSWLLFSGVWSGLASAEESVAGIFRSDFAAIARQSEQLGLPVACLVAPRKGENPELVANGRVGERVKWFLPVIVLPTSKLAAAINADGPAAVVLLDAQGNILGRCLPNDTPEDAVKRLEATAQNARAKLLAKLAKNETTPADCKNAVNSVVRMGGTTAELMPLLRHRLVEVRNIVTKALPTRPNDEVALAALDALSSEDIELRAACYRLAAATTNVPNTPPLKFWRESNEASRQSALAAWREAALSDMGPCNGLLLEFCEANFGKQVADGECANLAAEALRYANAKPREPGTDNTYIWGREVTAGRKVLPGDIIQLENCKLGKAIAVHHTQVIRKVLEPNRFEVLDQNTNGQKTVDSRQMDFSRLLEGTVKIYRPLPK